MRSWRRCLLCVGRREGEEEERGGGAGKVWGEARVEEGTPGGGFKQRGGAAPTVPSRYSLRG